MFCESTYFVKNQISLFSLPKPRKKRYEDIRPISFVISICVCLGKLVKKIN